MSNRKDERRILREGADAEGTAWGGVAKEEKPLARSFHECQECQGQQYLKWAPGSREKPRERERSTVSLE